MRSRCIDGCQDVSIHRKFFLVVQPRKGKRAIAHYIVGVHCKNYATGYAQGVYNNRSEVLLDEMKQRQQQRNGEVGGYKPEVIVVVQIAREYVVVTLLYKLQ